LFVDQIFLGDLIDKIKRPNISGSYFVDQTLRSTKLVHQILRSTKIVHQLFPALGLALSAVDSAAWRLVNSAIGAFVLMPSCLDDGSCLNDGAPRRWLFASTAASILLDLWLFSLWLFSLSGFLCQSSTFMVLLDGWSMISRPSSFFWCCQYHIVLSCLLASCR
jgi:hypothetical protein